MDTLAFSSQTSWPTEGADPDINLSAALSGSCALQTGIKLPAARNTAAAAAAAVLKIIFPIFSTNLFFPDLWLYLKNQLKNSINNFRKLSKRNAECYDKILCFGLSLKRHTGSEGVFLQSDDLPNDMESSIRPSAEDCRNKHRRKNREGIQLLYIRYFSVTETLNRI
ncbi:MAG: hypothetical protein HUJ54_07480 [Erysipelotrichaceae bacterium]|nr:hypothetical protein [Erysipelotrichaceae bacterium]